VGGEDGRVVGEQGNDERLIYEWVFCLAVSDLIKLFRRRLTDNNAVTAAMSSASEGSEWEKPVVDMSTDVNFWRTIVRMRSVDIYERQDHILKAKYELKVFCGGR